MFFSVKDNKKWKWVRAHVMIAEHIIGRKLFKEESVHHIDGDKLNNYPNNLAVMTNTQHGLCHASLEKCVLSYFGSGVSFNHDAGLYYDDVEKEQK